MAAERALAEVKDGDVLAEDLLDGHDNVLLAAGTRLTRAHLELAERRGVAALKVLTAQDAERAAGPGAPDSAAVAAALERLDRVFAKVRGRELMEAIRAAARAHLEAGNLPPEGD